MVIKFSFIEIYIFLLLAFIYLLDIIVINVIIILFHIIILLLAAINLLVNLEDTITVYCMINSLKTIKIFSKFNYENV